MKVVFAFVIASATTLCHAYLPSSAPRSSFVVSLSSSRSTTLSYSSSKSLDTEIDSAGERMKLEKLLHKEISIQDAESKHGMPWKTSIDKSTFKDEDLLYMKFWEYHIDFLQEHLTDLEVVECSNGKTDFSYNENTSKKARIVNICLRSKEYRKIRLTYYDAGENTQVYNAVCYPDPKYNLPVLGIDLLAFNRKKYLAIVDFQPLHQDESKHDMEFSNLLQPIKESYDNLKGRMSSKFYDETQFFSQQMLFSRFEDESIINKELFPAFQQYVQTHLDLIRSCDGSANVQDVLARQKEYDTYSAERDPATGLFTAMFGHEWAMDYVHDFLFSMSERKETTGAPTGGNPFAGGRPSGGGGNPFAAGGKPSGGGNPFANKGGNPMASQQKRETVSVSSTSR